LLAGSVLAGSVLAGSVLAGSVLAGSVLAGSVLAGSALAAAAQEDEGGQADDDRRGGGARHKRVDLAGPLADLLHRPVDILLRADPIGYGIDGARQFRAGAVDVRDQRVLINRLRLDLRVRHDVLRFLARPRPPAIQKLAWRWYLCSFGIEGLILSGLR
jgi:hypothetical protein